MNKIIGITLLTLHAGLSSAQTITYSEDFESGAPVAFTLVDNDGLTVHPSVSEFSDAWIRLADPANLNDTVMGSTSYFDPIGQADRWLITPAITLGAYGNVLSWEARSHDASFPDDYLVVVSTTDTQLASFADTVGDVFQENADWTNRSVNLSTFGLDNETVYVAFVNRTDDGFKLYVDDIEILIEDTLSVAELPNSIQVIVYPNPTRSVLKVKRDDVQELVVYGLEGKELRAIKNSQEISVGSLDNGQYLLKVVTDGGTRIVPFIKN